MMNKKNRIVLIACLAVILVLAVVLAIAGRTTEKPDDTTPDIGETNPAEKLPFAEKAQKVFASLESEKDISKLEVYKKDDLKYTVVFNAAIDGFLLQGYEHMLYNENFSKVITAAHTLEIKEEIADPISDEEYGVSPASAEYTVMLTDKNGKQQMLYVGSELISGAGYYCKLSDDERVFCVNNSVKKLFADNNSLLSTQLQNPLDSSKYHYTENFKLYKDLLPFVEVRFVPESERESGNAYGYYQMVYPGEYIPSDANYDAALKSLICPMADSIVTTEITPENIEKYGFAKPSYEVEYTLDGKTNKLYFGNRTGDGMIYVMSDYGFIGLAVVAERFPFLDYELVDFINPYLFGMNINYISRVSLSGQGFSDRYSLSGKNDALVVTDEKSGKTIDTQNFRNYYRDLLMLEMKGYAASAKEENWKFTFNIETIGGKIYEFKFYHTSERECYYTVNGKGEFYVDISDVEKLVSDARKLAAGEKVDPEAEF